MHLGLGLDPRSGHVQESASECVHKWNNKLMFPSVSLSPLSSLFLKKKKKKKKKKSTNKNL